MADFNILRLHEFPTIWSKSLTDETEPSYIIFPIISQMVDFPVPVCPTIINSISHIRSGYFNLYPNKFLK